MSDRYFADTPDLFGGQGQEKPPAFLSGMSLDQYIQHLVDLRAVIGGQALVRKWLPSRGVHAAPAPTFAYLKLALVKDKMVPVAGAFWQPVEGEAAKGPRVVRV